MNTDKVLENRHETLFLWEVRKSNPNGDPNGNEPRIDKYTKMCDVTDVCIKRSVRNYIAQKKGIDSILVTRLGEDNPQIVTLTERLTDFLFKSEEKKVNTSKVVETSINNILQDIEKKLSTSKGKEEKEILEAEKKLLIKNVEEFKSKKSAEKLKVLLEETKNPLLIKDLRSYLCGCFDDLRMFGSVLAIKGKTPLASLGGPLTGPIQIEVGTSLHRVVQSNKQITSIMAPDKKPADEGEEAEHGGGSFGDTHCIEYGLFATSAIANENAAKFTGLTTKDHDLFLKALWRGTRDRHTRSKNQVPRLLIDIEYNKPFHFGDLISPNSIKLNPKIDGTSGKPIDEESYRSLDNFAIDLTGFLGKINPKEEYVSSIRFASYGLMTLTTFKNGLSENLKNKICELTDIDFDKESENK